MALFPQRFFTQDDVALRTGPFGLKAPYKAASLNQPFCGQPKGVHQGFVASALGSVLTLSPGPEGYSNAKVQSNGDRAGLDVISTVPITLDFALATAFDFGPDGIQVILRANFTDGQHTTAEIITRTRTISVPVFTVGGSPASLDLATLSLDPVEPGTLSLDVDVDGFGITSITDDSNGGLFAGTGLPLGGTIDYETGEMTGVTAALTAASVVTAAYSRRVAKDEVLLCLVTGTPGAIVVNSTAPTNRDVPIAYPSVPFGYMPAGSMESLAAAVDILNEVAAARVDLQGVTHPDLKTRLDVDMAGPAMGTRLGRVFRSLRSNQYQVISGATEFNVSGSLSEVNRDFLPVLTLGGAGSETTVGAIAAPVDAVRNVCVLLDGTTFNRLIDNDTDRNVLFGRLVQEDDFVIDGVITFANALTAVVGDDQARFTIQLQVGDTLQGPDGKFYEVASIQTDAALTLRDGYQGTNASSGGLIRRRFKVQIKKIVAGVEVAGAPSATTQVQAILPTFLSHAAAYFDAGSFTYQPGELPPVPDATTTVPGKIALADAGSPFVGSINLQQGGVAVPGGPFHTLNFIGSPGALVELSPGVVDVTNLGPIGPPGIGGGPGPIGPTGGPGPSITQRTPLDKSAEQGGPGTGPILCTHTVNFGYTLTFLSGGFALVRDNFNFAVPNDQVEIIDIAPTGPSSATIQANVGAPGFFVDDHIKLYLNGCGF